jgi:CRISPR-associated protein Csm3
MKLKFQGKYIIKGKIVCETGLHIGGTTEGIEIGGVDLPVIRNSLTELPYIPGSSLKGKLRHLLEWELEKVFEEKNDKYPTHTCENNPDVKKLKEEISNLQGDERKKKEKEKEEKIKELVQSCPICVIFGASAATSGVTPTRLTVRDAIPSEDTIKEWEKWLGEKTYTELKTENTIDRVTSEANPRTMERVPAGSKFEFEMIFDVYQDEDKKRLKSLFTAMELLENSSLGGSGTRGHGKIKFEFDESSIEFRPIEYYKTGKDEDKKEDEIIKALKNAKSVKELLAKFPDKQEE